MFERFDINPIGDSDPIYLTSYNNVLVFRANDGVHNDELWVSDGSQEGTKMIKDIWEGGRGNPVAFTEYNDLLYFTAFNPYHGLWATDATTEGTHLVLIVDSMSDQISSELFVFKERLYFVLNNFNSHTQYLYKTDGTANGTELVKKISDSQTYSNHFTIYNDHFYFSGVDSIHGKELWVSDGSSQGTHLFKDINPIESSYPEKFVVSNNLLFFIAKDTESTNRSLWITDGNPENTRRVRNTQPDDYCRPVYMIDFQNKLFFSGTDNINGRELWVSDGTEEGTFMLKNLNSYFTPLPSSDPRFFYIFQDKLYFSAIGKAENGILVGEEIFVSDGTEEGTHLFTDLNIFEGSRPSAYYEYNDKLYFKAQINSHHSLWVSDGTEEGTNTLRPEEAELWDPLDVTYSFVEANGLLFFVAEYDSAGLELWSYADFTGISNKKENKVLKIYPNPSQDFIKIDLNESFVTGSIYNVSGQLIKSIAHDNFVNISDFEKGIYFVKVISKNGIYTGKFIKMPE